VSRSQVQGIDIFS